MVLTLVHGSLPTPQNPFTHRLRCQLRRMIRAVLPWRLVRTNLLPPHHTHAPPPDTASPHTAMQDGERYLMLGVAQRPKQQARGVFA